MDIVRASAKGEIDQVKKLLSEGKDCNSVDPKGRTALIEAAWGGYSDVVKLLVEKGADVNCADKSGFTPLMRAVEEEHLSTVAYLIGKGADVNSRGNVRRSTPLMLAAEKGNVKLIELLLDSGAELNAADQYDETALARAYRTEKLKAITYLESKGAVRKPDRSRYSYFEKKLPSSPTLTVPGWNEDDDDDIDEGLDDEENEVLKEQLDE